MKRSLVMLTLLAAVLSACGGSDLLAPPEQLKASADSGGAISLTWTATSGATAYQIFSGDNEGAEGSMPIAIVTGTSYETVLSAGPHYFFVLATDGSISSWPSNEAQATAE